MRGGRSTFDFGQGGRTTLTDRWIAGIFTDVRRIVPAALAFGTVGFMDANLERRNQF